MSLCKETLGNIFFFFHDLPHLSEKNAKICLKENLNKYISEYCYIQSYNSIFKNINRSFCRTDYICLTTETAKKYHKLPNVVFVSYFAQSSCTIP